MIVSFGFGAEAAPVRSLKANPAKLNAAGTGAADRVHFGEILVIRGLSRGFKPGLSNQDLPRV
jgi:hypothetical protein